ncbi:MAG: MFS transporter [Saccharofermentanales bacterium]
MIKRKIFNIDNIGFGGLQWFYWTTYCTFFPFIVPYLKSIGYDEIRIGVLMSLIAVACILGQPFWGSMIDRNISAGKVLVFSFLVSGATALLFPHVTGFFVLLIMIVLIVSFTENSMQSIIDSWAMNNIPSKPWLDYGLTRGMGSLGYAITAVIFGILLDRFGYGLMFYAHFALSFVTIGFCLFISRNNKLTESKPDHVRQSISIPFLSIGRSPRFIWFLISSTIIYIGFLGTATFLPLLLADKGGDNKALGLALFILAASEFPVLFASKKLLERYKDTTLIMVSMAFFVLRIFLHAVIPTAEGLIIIQATQALSFGLFLPSAVHYVKRLAPVGMSATFITIASSCYFGIGGILGNFLGGLLIDLAGIRSMLWCFTVSSVIGAFVFFVSPKSGSSGVS